MKILKGRVWVASFESGIAFIKDSILYQHKEDPFKTEIKDFEEDDQNNLWISTFAGILKYSDNSMSFYPFKDEKKGQPCDLHLKDGVLFMGRHV